MLSVRSTYYLINGHLFNILFIDINLMLVWCLFIEFYYY